jgi:thermitase
MPVKVLDSSGSGSYAAVAAGIIWAADHGARAMNLSLGGSTSSKTLCNAVSYAVSHGSLVVAAAGNSGTSAASYPAACKGAIGIAATDSNDVTPSWSNFGSPNVFVSAPGVSIYSTYLGGGYATLSGTSMATPFVTGLAGLLFGQTPTRTPANVKRILASTSDKGGNGAYSSDPYGTCEGCTWNATYGYGRINVLNALQGVPVAIPDFTLSIQPSSARLKRGKAVSFSVAVVPTGGFSGTVALSVSGLPAGVSGSFTPASVAGSGSSTLRVTTSSSPARGTFTLTVTGTGGALSHTATATLIVS